MFKIKPILLICCFSILVSLGTISYASELEIISSNVNKDYDIPEISGIVTNMPWKNDEDFLDAKEEFKTPILMAGFCAVLKNPLPGEEHNVALAAKSVNGEVIKPSKVFSQNQRIGPYTELRGYKKGSSYIGGNIIMTEGGGVCKIATTLYNLSVLSDLEIIERNYHSMPINYVPYGQDATVAYGFKDFSFKNTTNGNILIWSRLIGNRLYMGFYGSEYSPTVIWNHELSDIVKPSVKYVKNTNLAIGEMKTKIIGMDGAKVESTVTVSYKDGTVAIKKMNLSNYLPLPELIEIN